MWHDPVMCSEGTSEKFTLEAFYDHMELVFFFFKCPDQYKGNLLEQENRWGNITSGFQNKVLSVMYLKGT